jgi:succinate dehydrogenase flavin-adding protein (antitoxin of CptAB toxin-antitoxin module)
MTAGDRKEKIDKLKVLEGYDRGLLTNARCLAEGVDVPSLDGVAFIDPKGSQVEIIQAVGRAIRKVRGAKVQTKGTIVIPVFIEAGDDPEASIEASNFKPVWDVVNALRAHDNDLADKLDQYRTNMAKGALDSRSFISDKLIFDIPSSVDVEFSNALRTVLVEATTASWEFWFGLLEVFHEREGHCKVIMGHKEDGCKLGSWVSVQRLGKGKLSNGQIKRLDTLSFVWDPYAEFWEESFSKLQKFAYLYGHCKVPHRYKQEGLNLGSWVNNQRTNKAKLSPEKIERLNAIGFVWNTVLTAWDEGFSKLSQFYEREGHCRVAQTHKENGYNLGTFVNNTRRREDKLSLDQVKRLEDLGFVWDPFAEDWEEGFRKLQKFHEREGHCRVLKKQDNKLRAWVQNERSKKDSRSLDQIKRLDALDFIWNPHAEDWEESFSKLQKFHEKEGHFRVPEKQDNKLRGWVSRQRRRPNSLSADRIKRLNSLGFVWDPFTEQWEEGFSSLKSFKAREGHCRVPSIHKEDDGYRLGQWVGVQRNVKDRLSEDRMERLNSLGFIWTAN